MDPDRHVQLLVGSQEGTAHLPLAVLGPGDAALHLDPGLSLPPWWNAWRGHRFLSLPAFAGAQLGARILRPPLRLTWEQLKLFVLGCIPAQRPGSAFPGAARRCDASRRHRRELVIAHDNPTTWIWRRRGKLLCCYAVPVGATGGFGVFSFSKGWCLVVVSAWHLLWELEPTDSGTTPGPKLWSASIGHWPFSYEGPFTPCVTCASWPAALHPVYRERRDRLCLPLSAATDGRSQPRDGPLPSGCLCLHSFSCRG